MPADLIPHEAIPRLAAQIDSPDMLQILRHIQQAGFILNGRNMDEKTIDILGRLTELGLVDPGYEGPITGAPDLWSRNGNGSRVLRYLTSIPVGPHYEIPSSELAAWLIEQGKDRWWSVDGDPLLTERLTFPCPAEELAEELNTINQPLLVQAKKDDAEAKGQRVRKDKLNALVGHFAENLPVYGTGQMPFWGGDRFLYLRWKKSFEDWLLEEDNEAANQFDDGKA